MQYKPGICALFLTALTACGTETKPSSITGVEIDAECKPSLLEGYCEYIIGTEERVYGVLAADLNNDGNKDIFPHGHDKDDQAYIVPSLERTKGLNTPLDRHFCDAADLDFDGDNDIFCALGAQRGTGGYGNMISINSGKLDFEHVFAKGALDKDGRGRIPRFINLNNDEFIDLIITNYADNKQEQPEPSAIYYGREDISFEKETNFDLANSGELCVEVADWNNDGYEGFLLCDRQMDSRLYVNMEGTLTNVTQSLKHAKSWTDSKVYDFNHDGLLDFVAVTKGGLVMFFQNSGNPTEPFQKTRRTFHLPKILEIQNISPTLKLPRGAFQLGIIHANDDDHADLIIGTDIQLEDGSFLGDFVFYGPKFTKFESLGAASSGTGHIINYNENSVVIARAGANWSGKVILLTPDSKR